MIRLTANNDRCRDQNYNGQAAAATDDDAVQSTYPTYQLPDIDVNVSDAEYATRYIPPLPPTKDTIWTNEDADTFLARTLNSMSLEERNKAMEDVHGVSSSSSSSLRPTTTLSPSKPSATTTTEAQHSNKQEVANDDDPEWVAARLSQFDKEMKTYIADSATIADYHNSSFGASSSKPVATSTACSGPSRKQINDDSFSNDDTATAAIGSPGTKIEMIMAFQKATSQNSNYVQSLRIQFLRVESFNVTNAVIRMVSYFHLKLQLYGPKLLTRDIKIQDLQSIGKDCECLKCGYIQLLPLRDRSGRAIIVLIPSLVNETILPISRLRVAFYILQTALLDCTTTTGTTTTTTATTDKNNDHSNRGFVVITYNLGPKGGSSDYVTKMSVWKIAYLFNIYPIKIAAFHYCYDDISIKRLVSLGTIILGSKTRTRFRARQGSPTKIVYDLMTYGISPDILPFSPSGRFILSNHNLFIKQQEVFDATPDLAVVAHGDDDDYDRKRQQLPRQLYQRVIVPQNSDVLLKRGGQYHSHPGNIRFHSIIDQHFDFYESCMEKQDKKCMSQSVVEMIKYGRTNTNNIEDDMDTNENVTASTAETTSLGATNITPRPTPTSFSNNNKPSHIVLSRFLKRDDAGWIIIRDDEIIRDHVAHTFRNKRLKKNKKSKKVSHQQNQQRQGNNSKANAGGGLTKTTTEAAAVVPTSSLAIPTSISSGMNNNSILSCAYSGNDDDDHDDNNYHVGVIRRRDRINGGGSDGSDNSSAAAGVDGCFSMLDVFVPGVACNKRRKKG